MKGPATVRIFEQGGNWVIEESGTKIIAPFPLTDEHPHSPEYSGEAEQQVASFSERYIQTRNTLPTELLERVRVIAREIGVLQDLPPYVRK